MRGSLHGAGCNPWRIKQQNGTHRPDPRHPSRGWARVSTAAPAGGQRSGGRGRPPGLRGQQARAGPGLHPRPGRLYCPSSGQPRSLPSGPRPGSTAAPTVRAVIAWLPRRGAGLCRPHLSTSAPSPTSLPRRNPVQC